MIGDEPDPNNPNLSIAYTLGNLIELLERVAIATEDIAAKMDLAEKIREVD